MTEKMIPLSVVDALILKLQDSEVPVNGMNCYDWEGVQEVILSLQKLKKEAISIPTESEPPKHTAKQLLDWIKSWTPEQIKTFHELADSIDIASARIKEPKYAVEMLSGACKLHYHDNCGYSKCKCICHEGNKPLEQRIKDRIVELKQWQKDFPSGKEWHQELIDELRKLLK